MSTGLGVCLSGLDGANPLAFLAALGVLRTLSLKFSAAKLSWVVHTGRWTPHITDVDLSIESLPGCLSKLLPSQLRTPWTADKRLPFAASRFSNLALELTRDTTTNRDSLDLLAALGSEAFQDAKGQFEDTALRMVRSGDSAGQGFLDYACKIAKNTTTEDLAACLFERWQYANRGSSLRWDPAENREYALQATNPSGDAALSVIGANRLAIEALSLFPTQPQHEGLATTGFCRSGVRTGLEFRWPIWTPQLPLSVVRSLLAYRGLMTNPVDPAHVRAVGIQAVYSCRQIKPNQYYRNFSPAELLV